VTLLHPFEVPSSSVCINVRSIGIQCGPCLGSGCWFVAGSTLRRGLCNWVYITCVAPPVRRAAVRPGPLATSGSLGVSPLFDIILAHI